MIKTINNFLLISRLINDKNFLFIFLLIFFSSLFELLSITMIIPLISNFFDPEYYLKVKNILDSNIILKNLKINNYNFFLLFLFISSYYLKALFLIFSLRMQLKYSFDIGQKISARLFYKYIKIDYPKYVNLVNSEISRNILKEVGVFISSFLVPFLFLLSEILIIIFILSFLLFYEYKLTLVFFFSSLLIISLYYLIIKNRFSKWGTMRQVYEEKKLKIIQNVFFSLKDIKIFENEEYYYSRFLKIEKYLLKLSINQNLFLNLPRILIEIIAITFFCIIFVFFFDEQSFKIIIPLLAVYGFACLRLLPSFGKILGNLQNIKFSKSAVNLLANELIIENNNEKNIYIENKKKIFINNSIELVNVRFNHEGSSKQTLEDVNFRLNLPNKVLIVGNSGSGKTTFIDILLGLQKCSSGSIVIDGQVVRPNNFNWISNFSYVSQKPFFFENSLAENISFKEIYKQDEKQSVEEILKICELWDIYSSLNFDLNLNFGELSKKLSGGQHQRLALARCLYRNSKILILDEATNALDGLTERKVLDNIFRRYKDKSIIMISHNQNLSNYCDEVFFIDNKSINRLK
jgi:ABC-type multidrug transport system fused ATPase/permease subunit